MKGEVEASRARLALANANLGRGHRLFAQAVSAEQDLIAARTAAIEAGIAYRQERSQVSAAGGCGSKGGLNRLGIVAPIADQVIARSDPDDRDVTGLTLGGVDVRCDAPHEVKELSIMIIPRLDGRR